MFFFMARFDYQPLRKEFTFWDFLSKQIWQPSSSHVFLRKDPSKDPTKRSRLMNFQLKRILHPSKNHRTAIRSLCTYVVDETQPAIFLILILRWSRRSMHGWIISFAYTPGGFKGLWNVYPKNLGGKGSNLFASLFFQFFAKEKTHLSEFWGPKNSAGRRSSADGRALEGHGCWCETGPPRMSQLSVTRKWILTCLVNGSLICLGNDLNPFWMFFVDWLQEWGDEQCLSCGCWELHVKVNPTTTWNDDEAAGTFVTHTIHGCLVFTYMNGWCLEYVYGKSIHGSDSPLL